MLAGTAQAQEAVIGAVGLDDRRIAAADPRIAAVGRLNLSGAGFCTATLIAPALVLTAAHCLTNRRNGQPIPPDRIHFVAAYRKGRYLANRRGKAVSIHEGFTRDGGPGAAQMKADIALVVLDRPIPASLVQPIPIDRRTGSVRLTVPLTLVSYARDRAYLPSIEQGCVVRSMEGRALLTDCDVNFGASGAPVLSESDGVFRVLGVVSGSTTRSGLRRTVAVRVHQAP